MVFKGLQSMKNSKDPRGHHMWSAAIITHSLELNRDYFAATTWLWACVYHNILYHARTCTWCMCPSASGQKNNNKPLQTNLGVVTPHGVTWNSNSVSFLLGLKTPGMKVINNCLFLHFHYCKSRLIKMKHIKMISIDWQMWSHVNNMSMGSPEICDVNWVGVRSQILL